MTPPADVAGSRRSDGSSAPPGTTAVAVRARPRATRRLAAALTALALLAGCSAQPDVSDDDAVGSSGGGVEATPRATSEPPRPTVAPEAPETAPPPVELPDPPATRGALQRRLERLVSAAVAAAPEVSLAVLVVDEHGREVVAHRADTPVIPASTLKIVTAAAVLTTLGPSTRLTTTADATSGLGPDGVLRGDLVLRGVGDPALATDDYGRYVYPARPHTSLAALADALVDAGLTRVTGSVRGSAPGFGGEPLPSGWRDNYLADLDGRFIGGLTVDGGLRTLVEHPEGDDRRRRSRRGLDEPPRPPAQPETPPVVKVELARNPAMVTAQALTRMLRDRGVTVDGRPTTGEPDEPTVARLASVSSPPVLDLVRFMMQRSDNHLADQLFQVVGRARTGEGSWDRGSRAVRQVLDRFGVDHAGARFADGSGLSRDDRVTARLLVELDRTLSSSPRWAESWRVVQAVAGEAGTLRTRLRGTPASGRFLGKTGSLRDVSAVNGQLVSRDPHADGAARYHLAVIGNDTDDRGRAVTRALMDEVVLALVADLDGCRLDHASSEAGPLGIRPRVVVC